MTRTPLDRLPTGISSIVVVLVLAELVGACGASRLSRIQHSIGPAPVAPNEQTMGRLVVHTPALTTGNSGDDGPFGSEPYALLDSSDRPLQRISNRWGPEPVPLEAGEYVIHANAMKQRVAVRVQIVAGRTTEVHLDGRWKPTLTPG